MCCVGSHERIVHELVELRATRTRGHHRCIHACSVEERRHLAATARGNEGDDRAALTCATGTAGAVQVGLVFLGHVGLQDETNVVNVDAASCHIRRHEYIDAARFELLEVALTLRLVEIAVQGDGAHARILKIHRHAFGAKTRASEDEHPAAGASKLFDDRIAIPALHDEDAVVNIGVLILFTGDLVHGSIHEELVNEREHGLVERCREEELLTTLLRHAQDALHRLEEAEVAHLVGLVKDGDADVREIEMSLAFEVFDTARRADDDIDTATKGSHLTLLRDAAIHLGREQTHGAGNRLDRAVDLEGELTRRGDDERARGTPDAAARVTVVTAHEEEALHEGRTEGDRLAGSGAAAAEDVAATQHIRDRGDLDGEGAFGAEVGECADDVLAEAEISELDALCVFLGNLGCLEAGEDLVFGELAGSFATVIAAAGSTLAGATLATFFAEAFTGLLEVVIAARGALGTFGTVGAGCTLEAVVARGALGTILTVEAVGTLEAILAVATVAALGTLETIATLVSLAAFRALKAVPARRTCIIPLREAAVVTATVAALLATVIAGETIATVKAVVAIETAITVVPLEAATAVVPVSTAVIAAVKSTCIAAAIIPVITATLVSPTATVETAVVTREAVVATVVTVEAATLIALVSTTIVTTPAVPTALVALPAVAVPLGAAVARISAAFAATIEPFARCATVLDGTGATRCIARTGRTVGTALAVSRNVILGRLEPALALWHGFFSRLTACIAHTGNGAHLRNFNTTPHPSLRRVACNGADAGMVP